MSGGDKVWDGRGDRLSDARMSSNSGRAADDMRLGALHMRLLLHLGRQNSRRGWVRVSQTEIAERWGTTRSRVCVAVNQLVKWRYLKKRDQVQSGESFCLYKVLLDDDDGDEGGVLQEEHSPPEGGVPSTEQGCSPHDNTSVPHIGHTNREAEKADSPPKPPEGGGGGELLVDWIEELRAEGCAPDVLDHLLLPLLAAGLKPWKGADDPRLPARQLCEDFRRRTAPVLRAAADRLLDTHRYRLPPVAAVRAAVKAEGDRAWLAKRREQAVSAAEPEMQRFDAGSPEFERELARWRREDPAHARTIEQRGFVRLRIERRETAA